MNMKVKEWNGYKKGINFGGWFSQCDYTEKHFEEFIVERDFEKVAAAGYDHIRLPFDYNIVQNKDGSFIEKGFCYIDNVVKMCEKDGLNLILDLHKAAGYSFDKDECESGFFDNKAYQEMFYRLWEKMAERYAMHTPNVAFELLNEVTDKELCSKWNEIALECIRRIRNISANVVISVGGYWNNDILTVNDIFIPPDKNIVYNVHCYAPHIFTHQGASWMDMMPEDYRCDMSQPLRAMREDCEKYMPYTLSEFDGVWDSEETLGEKYFINLFRPAVETVLKRDVVLYCGEYGVIGLAGEKNIREWYGAIESAMDKYNVGRAAWCYRGLNFGMS